MRVVDDLTDEVDHAVWELPPRLVGVVHGPIDPVAEAELASEMDRQSSRSEGEIVGADAIDEGVAKGSLVVDGRTIALTHAYTHRHDNEEGLLDGPELRILLADRELPHTLLAGVYTARLDELARKGGVQGVLLRVDPRKLTGGVRGVLLMAEKNPGKSLTSFSFSGGGGFRKLTVGNNRVLGEAHHQSLRGGPAFEYSATFSAPLFREERRVGR